MIKQLKLYENRIALVLCLLLFFWFAWMSFASDGAWGGADNYEHYKFSRYSWTHPEFLLDHWGKPLFTLLSSPFSQFGFTGIKIFNVLTGIGSAYFAFRIARKLGYQNSLAVIFFTCFIPVHFIMMMSGMTEILFGFVTVLSLYLLLEKKYILSSVIISFLPFARTEGIVIVPLFFIALLYFRQFKAVPFLATGVILYSLIGGYYYDDFFWVVTKSPYGDARAIYGSGGLFDFLNAYPEITGTIMGVLFLAGLLAVLIEALKKRNRDLSFIEIFLIAAPVIIYFVFHSVLWWKGMGGSLGLTRVMAAVMPLTAVVCLRGWNIFHRRVWSANLFLNITATVILMFFVIRAATDIYRVPVPLTPPEQLVKQASDWLIASGYANNKMHYHDPFFVQMIDVDPTDHSLMEQYIPDRAQPQNGISVGTLVLWDAHFSPNEGGLPLKNLSENEHFRMVQRFVPTEPFTVLGGYNYEICIFQKIK